MKLKSVTLKFFRNIVEPQTFQIEDDVTCLIGKNEAGKTSVLKALHRINPANGDDTIFDLVTEYPRWRLSRDRRSQNLENVTPVQVTFVLEEADLRALEALFGARLPESTVCNVTRSYANTVSAWLTCDLAEVVRAAGAEASVGDEDIESLVESLSAQEATARAKQLAKELKDAGEHARSKVLGAFPAALAKYEFLTSNTTIQEQHDALLAQVPKFFYFSTYELLPGEIDLTKLSAKLRNNKPLTSGERTMVALLARAGEKPADFLDENYDSRRAELQAASSELSARVFEYWTQNTDLEVEFDTDMIDVGPTPQGHPEYHRFLKVQLRDNRHGGVVTNFATRSSGFQWFFSFFAAFSEHQDSDAPLIVLLDEPGTSLHGEAQKDFVRFVYGELGASKQTLYTTHSQFMVDPARYEKLRAVHDRATRQNPDLGVNISDVNLSADSDTLLPVESALGYSVSQHLFLGGGHHLAVEGSSDFVYLQRMTEHLTASGKTGLDPRLAIIPVGGDGNMPAFVALLGRRLKVSALIDGDRSLAKYHRVLAAARNNGVPESALVLCGDSVHAMPTNSDIEDLFDVQDYLRLYNLAFKTTLTVADLPATNEPILRRIGNVRGSFDHAQPAHALTDNRDVFFSAILPATEERFTSLFAKLSATLA